MAHLFLISHLSDRTPKDKPPKRYPEVSEMILKKTHSPKRTKPITFFFKKTFHIFGGLIPRRCGGGGIVPWMWRQQRDREIGLRHQFQPPVRVIDGQHCRQRELAAGRGWRGRGFGPRPHCYSKITKTLVYPNLEPRTQPH